MASAWVIGSILTSGNLNSGNLVMSVFPSLPNCLATRSSSFFNSFSISGFESTSLPPLQSENSSWFKDSNHSSGYLRALLLVFANFVKEQLLDGIGWLVQNWRNNGNVTASLCAQNADTGKNGLCQHLEINIILVLSLPIAMVTVLGIW